MQNCHQSYFSLANSATVGRVAKFLTLVITALIISACSPSDRTPGQWLRGKAVETLPQDWAFTDNFQEIYVEVKTPYFIPHSVTIWCGQVGGKLFIGARDPETKNWPGWLDKNHDIRLKIGDNIYSVAASDVSDEVTLEGVRAAYRKKYDIQPSPDGKPRNVRYWAVVARK